MDQLIKSLSALVQAAGDAPEISEAAALAVWNHVAGEGLRQQTLATSLQDKKLTVAVSEPVWQQQLQPMSGQFLFRLNAILGQGAVRWIEFRVDAAVFRAGREQKQQKSGLPADSRPAAQPIPIELVSAAASIHDPSLRRAFLGAATNSVRRHEKRRAMNEPS